MTVRGLSPNLPHVAHIHGVLNHKNVCPPASAQKLPPIIVPGIIDTVAGQPSYGPILATLTTSGDASPASALALGRALVSDAHGVIRYHRTITLPHAVAQDHRRARVQPTTGPPGERCMPRAARRRCSRMTRTWTSMAPPLFTRVSTDAFGGDVTVAPATATRYPCGYWKAGSVSAVGRRSR